MDCEARQEQLGALLDGEAAAADLSALFRHVGECADCRSYFDTLTRLRGAAARDRDLLAPGADDLLLPLPRRAAARGRFRSGAGRWLRRPAAGWRLPVPAALAAAVILLLGGALLGARWAAVRGGAQGPAGRSSVVVVCSLPEVVVR